ncbi:GDSL esterase/lipase At5g45670 [Linum perenne]
MGNPSNLKRSPPPSFSIIVAVVLAAATAVDGLSHPPEVPCYFIFGDSLFDNGNNNNLDTLTKSNYPPYGVIFPTGPTGRFTNGRTTADIVGELMGFESFIPVFCVQS